MPKNRTRRWPFTAKGTSSDSASNQSQISSDTKSWSIYRNITELPLSRWSSLTADGYLQALAKEGTPPETELKAAEHEIRLQYADAAGDSQYRLYVNLVNEISRLEITLAQIESLITTLRSAYHPILAKELNGLVGTGFPFNVNKPAEYDRDLDRGYRRSRGLKITLALKSTSLVEIEKKYKGGETKSTREYYMGALIVLSDDAGYPLSDQITVWEFLERIRRYNKKFAQPLKRKK